MEDTWRERMIGTKFVLEDTDTNRQEKYASMIHKFEPSITLRNARAKCWTAFSNASLFIT